MQLNTYDDFYTGGIEKPYNNKTIVKGNKREVFFKCFREMWGQIFWPFLASEKTLKGDFRFNIFI